MYLKVSKVGKLLKLARLYENCVGLVYKNKIVFFWLSYREKMS